jgi:hypothetical protein
MDLAYASQSQRNEGAERPLRCQQISSHHVRCENLCVTGSEETPEELRRSRALSPQCTGSFCSRRPSLNMPNDENRRKEYNRLVGDSLQTYSRQNVQDEVAKSLKLMDELLILVKENDSCPKNSQKMG